MQKDLLWNELLGILQQLGIEIRWSRGEFQGGLYSTHGVQQFLLNEDHPQDWHIRVLCRELTQVDISEIYLSPALRKSINTSDGLDCEEVVSLDTPEQRDHEIGAN